MTDIRLDRERNRVDVDGEEFIADELFELCRDALSVRVGEPEESVVSRWPLTKIHAVFSELRQAGYGRVELYQLRLAVQETAGARREQTVLLPLFFDSRDAAQAAGDALKACLAPLRSIHPLSGHLTQSSVSIVPKK